MLNLILKILVKHWLILYKGGRVGGGGGGHTQMSILSKMILWWHLSKIEASTSYFEIKFWLVENIRSIHGIGLFITCAFVNHLCISADDVRESISQPVEWIILSFHQYVQWAFKSPVTIEQRGNSSFICLRRISKFVQKISSSSWIWLGGY